MRTRVITTATKWGNSTGIRIPKAVVTRAEICEGDQLQLEVKGPGIIVVRAVKKEQSLDALLARITPKNRHRETVWGREKAKKFCE